MGLWLLRIKMVLLKQFNEYLYRFVPSTVPMIDQDLAAYQYRKVTQNDIPAWLHDNDMMGLIQ